MEVVIAETPYSFLHRLGEAQVLFHVTFRLQWIQISSYLQQEVQRTNLTTTFPILEVSH